MPSPPPKARDALHFAASSAAAIEPYLPPRTTDPTSTSSPPPPPPPPPQSSPSPSPSASPPPSSPLNRPFVTLTFATSLDSALALAPGTQTALSGPASKAMTHHLRSRHAAILVGAGTAVADDPSLNCRIEGVGGYGGEEGEPLAGQPRPVVVDPRGRWDFSGGEDGGKGLAKVLRLAGEGRGRAPWVVVAEGVGGRALGRRRRDVLEGCGGRVLEVRVREEDGRMEWGDVLGRLAAEGIESVMVEGGAGVINALLEPRNVGLVDSVIVTVAPTWLGQGGVVVSPPRRVDGEGRPVAAARLKEVKWCPLGEDVVLCGRL
ncbi:riboflavin biosynthesis protein [Diplodia corticola]|uniref:2,5-diamino-6-ribosylamino-4(3H)-pyrimidinone 5'-phosphate reductase n=1 Tax=Diplodia corticola TaxID=236234 RepID=A0A1J9QTE7_9PEZI|nr:riboflavin biosynthesis protein [Diplodia corticola]OJD31665.1 riboflavin biosynthesis protein [Diplodia corticola]